MIMDPLARSLMTETAEDSIVDAALSVADASEDIPDEYQAMDMNELKDTANEIEEIANRDYLPDVPDYAEMPEDDVEAIIKNNAEPDSDIDMYSDDSSEEITIFGSEEPDIEIEPNPEDDIPEWAKAIDRADNNPYNHVPAVITKDMTMEAETLEDFIYLDSIREEQLSKIDSMMKAARSENMMEFID